MTRIQCRGSIAWVAIVVALLSSNIAKAQVGIDPGPPREPGGLVNDMLTGAIYDIENKKLAEKQLDRAQAKLIRDKERCDKAAVERDARRIDNLKYRITIDEWLIRWNKRCYPDFYPIRTDEVSIAAIAQAAHPIQGPYPPTRYPIAGPLASAPIFPITILNSELKGPSVSFVVDGVSYQAAVNSSQNLAVRLDSVITYDSGGSLGEQSFTLSPGGFEFRSSPEGWVFYKLPYAR